MVDTDCWCDLVFKTDVALLTEFVQKAKKSVTCYTANRPTVTEYAANIYVKELE